MLAQLREMAESEAQRVFALGVKDAIDNHGGAWSPAMDDAYMAAQRVVAAVKELQDHLEVAVQVADDEAPDLTLAALLAENAGYVSELELRAIWGDK